MASSAVDEIPDLVEAPRDENQDRERLVELIAEATSKYAVKDYNTAAELYSKAAELQGELNGEMAIENADLLYSYGKCLYFVAVSKSDVLGSKAAGEKVGNIKEEKKSKPKKAANGALADKEQKVAEEVVAKIATEEEPGKAESSSSKPGNTPFIQFTGDENWDDSDDEEVDGDEEEEEDEDDFSNAFEILDLGRVLLNKKLEKLQEEAAESDGKGKGKESSTADSAELRQVKERLADTHDLQAEISLEGERFPNAVLDLRAALALKETLYPPENSQIAECHYKLSLALEFSSVTQEKDENGEVVDGKEATVDTAMREEAAVEMEKAIESCELRIKKEQAEVDAQTANAPEDPSVKQISQKDIDEVKEMVADMRQRLVDLRGAPVSVNDPTSTGTLDGTNPISGILGQILGESPEQQKLRLEEASKNANDLSGLVKRKKPKKEDGQTATTTSESTPQHSGLLLSTPSPANSTATSGKRKLDEIEDDKTPTTAAAAEGEDASAPKKLRVEDLLD